MKGDHNNRKRSKCDVLMNLFLFFFLILIGKLSVGREKETEERERKLEVKQHRSPMKYSLLLEQDNFNVVLHENLLRGRKKEKKTHRSQKLPCKK